MLFPIRPITLRVSGGQKSPMLRSGQSKQAGSSYPRASEEPLSSFLTKCKKLSNYRRRHTVKKRHIYQQRTKHNLHSQAYLLHRKSKTLISASYQQIKQKTHHSKAPRSQDTASPPPPSPSAHPPRPNAVSRTPPTPASSRSRPPAARPGNRTLRCRGRSRGAGDFPGFVRSH